MGLVWEWQEDLLSGVFWQGEVGGGADLGDNLDHGLGEDRDLDFLEEDQDLDFLDDVDDMRSWQICKGLYRFVCQTSHIYTKFILDIG